MITVNIEVTSIQTILFEFEYVMHFSAFLSKNTLCNWELRNFPLEKYKKCSNRNLK